MRIPRSVDPVVAVDAVAIGAVAIDVMPIVIEGSFTLEQAEKQFQIFMEDEPQAARAFVDSEWEPGVRSFSRRCGVFVFVAYDGGYRFTEGLSV